MLKRKNSPYENIESLIAVGMKIKGEITSQGSVRIDGNVEGKLTVAGDLVLGEKGAIQGEAQANNIILAGKMVGNVSAVERLDITATGSVTGDVSCRVITIEEGGILEGTTRMCAQSSNDEVRLKAAK